MEGDEDEKIDNEAGDGLSLLSGSDGGDDEETFSSDKVNNKVRVYWKWDPPPLWVNFEPFFLETMF